MRKILIMNLDATDEDDDSPVDPSTGKRKKTGRLTVTLVTGESIILGSPGVPLDYEIADNRDLVIVDEDDAEVGHYVEGAWIGVYQSPF